MMASTSLDPLPEEKPTLLTLPAEIRLEIYSHVLHDIRVWAPYNWHPNPNACTAHPFNVLRVCKKMRDEAQEIADGAPITLMATEPGITIQAPSSVATATPTTNCNSVQRPPPHIDTIPPKVCRQIESLEFLSDDLNVPGILDEYPHYLFPRLRAIDLVTPYAPLINADVYPGQEYEYQISVPEEYINHLIDTGVTETAFDNDLLNNINGLWRGMGDEAAISERGLTMQFWCGLHASSIYQDGYRFRMREHEWASMSCVSVPFLLSVCGILAYMAREIGLLTRTIAASLEREWNQVGEAETGDNNLRRRTCGVVEACFDAGRSRQK